MSGHLIGTDATLTIDGYEDVSLLVTQWPSIVATQPQQTDRPLGTHEMSQETSYRMVIKGCEALSMLVKECPLPVAGKGSGQVVLYETLGGHIKHWAAHGPFKFESATVFEGDGTAPLCELTAVEVGDFNIITEPTPAEAGFVLYAATISWANAAPVNEQARKDFEVQALVLAVKHYRYAQNDMALRTLFERRTDGTYACDWLDGAWIGYQAGRESVVVELPQEQCLEAGVFAYDATDTRIAIEAAGGSVKA